MTAAPSLSELPIAMLAPTADEYAIRRGDLVRVPLQSWCCSFVEGQVCDVLCNGQVIVETAERARLKVRADECTILLTRGSGRESRGMMDEKNAELSDLELLETLIRLLQDSAGVTIGNHDSYVRLIEHPKFKEAFAIAFQAVHREEVQAHTLEFIYQAIRAVWFYVGMIDARNERAAATEDAN